MTTEQVSGSSAVPKSTPSDILLDGLFVGMIGALVVAAWFLVLDSVAGHPLWTPALLGNWLLHGPSTSMNAIQPIAVAAYTAFHFTSFIAVGVLLSYLMTLFERFPMMFFVLLVLALCLQAGFFVLDAILGAQLMHQLQPWAVVTGNMLAAAAMAFYLWKRHPSVLRGVDHLWDDEP